MDIKKLMTSIDSLPVGAVDDGRPKGSCAIDPVYPPKVAESGRRPSAAAS